MVGTCGSRPIRNTLHTILFRDLIERHDVSHPRAVTDLAHWLVDNTALIVLRQQPHRVSQVAGPQGSQVRVADYLEWFEDAYFLFTVRLFDPSLARSNTNWKRSTVSITPWSPRCRPAFSSIPAILENLVFTALRRLYPEIYY